MSEKEKKIKELLERTSELDSIEDDEDSSSMANQYVQEARKKANRLKQSKWFFTYGPMRAHSY